MNPDTTIRPWLLACGKQYGIREARDYRYPDAPARGDQNPYCVYQLMSFVPSEEGTQDQSTKTANIATRSYWQAWIQTVQVDLFESQNGMYELAAMTIAAKRNPVFIQLFREHGCSFEGVTSVVNLSTFDDSRIDYHHRLTCTFSVTVEHSLDDANAVVDEIKLAIESGGYEWTIDDTGYE